MISRSNRTPNWDSDEYKKELLRNLKKYKGIITNPLYNCLNALLELEISALSSEISPNRREALSRVDFDLYRQISIYNIMCRIQRIFEEDKDKLHIYKTNWAKELSVSVQGTRINEDDFDENPDLYLFQFDFKPMEVFSGSKTVPVIKIGNVDLHEYEVREGQTQKNIEAYQRLTEKKKNSRYGTFVGTAKDESDPALFNNPGSFGTCNDDMMMFKYLRDERVKKYLKVLEYYQNKKGLTDAEKLAIEMSQKYHGLLLQELGSSADMFEPVQYHVDEQVQVLTRPNFRVRNTIHYVE